MQSSHNFTLEPKYFRTELLANKLFYASTNFNQLTKMRLLLKLPLPLPFPATAEIEEKAPKTNGKLLSIMPTTLLWLLLFLELLPWLVAPLASVLTLVAIAANVSNPN